MTLFPPVSTQPAGGAGVHDHTKHTDRTRTLWLPASLFVPHTGAPAIVVNVGAQPYWAYSAYAFPNAAVSRVVATMIIPPDNAGTSVTWVGYFSDDAAAAGNIVFKTSALGIPTGGNPLGLTAEGNTIRAAPIGLLTISTFNTINLGTPSPGDMLRTTFGRDGGHVLDTYSGVVYFIGAALQYAADM